jgi:hypothetical protein
MKICVHSNRGPRGEEIPCAFWLGGRRLPVLGVMERWTDSVHHYYEVMVDDGRRFVLRYEPGMRSWELAAVFAATRKAPPKPVAKPAAVTPPAKPAVPAGPRRFFTSFRKPPVTPKVS